jgi:6-phosphofructokinase
MTGSKGRVAIVFSGGPAPGANAVISAAASTFKRDGYEVVGILHGYSALTDYNAKTRPLVEGEDYRVISDRDLRGLRNARGIFIGTARANPGKAIKKPADLKDEKKSEKLRNVYEGLVSLGVSALVSIGGDDTLKTGNFLYEYQKGLPADAKRVKVVHLPKTIDNDYRGIDFTFGFFTAVEVMAQEVQTLRADAMANKAYFIVETMGRKAGWLAYGVAIAGEAHMVLGVEDVVDDLVVEEKVVGADGVATSVPKLSLDALAERIVKLIRAREASGKKYGTVVLAEGLGEMLSEKYLEGLPRDDHGHISLARLDLSKMVAEAVSKRYEQQTGKPKKLTGVQLGYEARCAAPHAFDVMLGSSLGVGAHRAIVEKGLDGHMVSIQGQLQLVFVPFHELVDPKTLITEVRFIETGSDFQRLARTLETQLPKG